MTVEAADTPVVFDSMPPAVFFEVSEVSFEFRDMFEVFPPVEFRSFRFYELPT